MPLSLNGLSLSPLDSFQSFLRPKPGKFGKSSYILADIIVVQVGMITGVAGFDLDRCRNQAITPEA